MTDICAFWYGPRLRRIDTVCLASMVHQGHRVKLFAYGPISNLPRGITPCDAREILDPRAIFARLGAADPDAPEPIHILHLSDFFRIALMKARQGFWLDTDIYLMRPIEHPAETFYLCREARGRLGVSALCLPPDHPVIEEFDAYRRGAATLPNWLGVKRRWLKPLLLRLRGRPVTPGTVGITVFANDGVSRLARRHGFFDDAAPKHEFYLWTGRESERFYDPDHAAELLDNPSVRGFHVLRKAPSEAPAAPGSAYDHATRQVAYLLGD